MDINDLMMLVDGDVDESVFKVIEDVDLNSVEVDYDSEKRIEDLDLSDIKCGVLVRSDGYRGFVCYEGVVMVDGEYWLCDFVSEGVMWKVVDVDVVKEYF